jgi:dUTP pyrophosphatase
MDQHPGTEPIDRATLRVSLLRDGAAPPTYKTDGAAGMDLTALLEEPITIETNGIAHVPTGVAVAIPRGYEGQVRPRSGLAFKHGVTVVNAPGTIDWDYRGELIVGLINLGREPFTIETGMRIAQLVIAPVSRVTIQETDALDETARGEGGFGSTGMQG